MKVAGNRLKVGMAIEHEGKLWVITSAHSVKPGKGGAYMQVEMKTVPGGTKFSTRFRSDETVTRAHLEERPCQLIYFNKDEYTFMDNELFNQIVISADDMSSEVLPFLTEGVTVKMLMYNDNIISVMAPDSAVLTVVETEPYIKGQTATSSDKKAKLSNGIEIMVPQYIESGTDVVVDTSDLSFISKADK